MENRKFKLIRDEFPDWKISFERVNENNYSIFYENILVVSLVRNEDRTKEGEIRINSLSNSEVEILKSKNVPVRKMNNFFGRDEVWVVDVLYVPKEMKKLTNMVD